MEHATLEPLDQAIVSIDLVRVLLSIMAAFAQMFLAELFPLRIRVPAPAFWQFPTVAAVVALAASAVGMRRAARTDPPSTPT